MLWIVQQTRRKAAETGKYGDGNLSCPSPVGAIRRNPQRLRRNGVTTLVPGGCRAGCGACCIAPSISSAIPGMPDGKPAGVRCVQLTADNQCAIFGDPRRPAVCASLRATVEMCGDNADVTATHTFAMRVLGELERQTRA